MTHISEEPERSETKAMRERNGPGRPVKTAVARARKIQRFLTQPFFVGEEYTGIPGKFVPLDETVRGFREIIDGVHDDLNESAFYMAGSINDVVQRAREMA